MIELSWIETLSTCALKGGRKENDSYKYNKETVIRNVFNFFL